jgi:uncharacterized protein (DUF1810 family)
MAPILNHYGIKSLKYNSVNTMSSEAKLAEFVAAQNEVYGQVLGELSAGRKETHWIWFIFPQMAGLGSSPMCQMFGIASKVEAQLYLKHPVLGPRLRECTQIMLSLSEPRIGSILAIRMIASSARP